MIVDVIHYCSVITLVMDFNTFKERVQQELPYLVDVINWDWVKGIADLDKQDDYFGEYHTCYVWNNLFKNGKYKEQQCRSGLAYVYTSLDDGKYFFETYGFGSCPVCDTYSGLYKSADVYLQLIKDLKDGQVLDETQLETEKQKEEDFWKNGI